MRGLRLLFLLLSLVALSPIGAAAELLPSPPGKRESGAGALLGVPLQAELQKLLIWDDVESSCRLPHPTEAVPTPVRTPVLVLHLWADYCQPCLREFPVLRDFAERLEGEYHGQVRFLFVSLSSSPRELRAFLLKHRELLPKSAEYCDTTLEQELGRHLASGVALPATLVLDDRRQVRDAVLGSIGYHRAQLGRSIARLLLPLRVAGSL